ncbi:MAG: hypothetical protein AAGF77_10385 [Bacteroidota bacterium]
MDDIDILFYNQHGIAFLWKRYLGRNFGKVQLVFRNTGFSFSFHQLLQFSDTIKALLKEETTNNHNSNTQREESVFMLDTPLQELSLAVNFKELVAIEELIVRTILTVGLGHLSAVATPIVKTEAG